CAASSCSSSSPPSTAGSLSPPRCCCPRRRCSTASATGTGPTWPRPSSAAPRAGWGPWTRPSPRSCRTGSWRPRWQPTAPSTGPRWPTSSARGAGADRTHRATSIASAAVHAAVTIVLALLGVPVGALLNVVIDRVPDRVPLRGPREGEPADPVHLGPVPPQPRLLRAGGREHLPRRWLWVELTTVAVLAVVGLRAGDDLRVVPLALLGAALVAVTVIDLQLLRIPDRVTFPTLAVSVPLVAAVSLRYDGGEAFVGGLIGMVTYFVALLVPHLVYPKGMGFGDVKLALLMGLHLGW